MKKLFIILALAFLLLPSAAGAAEPASPTNFYPIIQCDTVADPTPCTPCELFVELDRVINFVLFGITGPIAVFMIILSGGMILLGAGNTTILAKGKDLLKNTILGVTVILLSWVATTFLLQALTGGETAWYEVSCPTYLSEIETPQNLTVLPLTATVQPYTPVEIPEDIIPIPEAATVAARVDLCPVSPPKYGCTSDKCAKYQEAIKKYASGAVSAPLLGAIMFHESSCNVKATHFDANTNGKSYGLMQLYPKVANQYREGCVKANPETGKIENMPINAGWLMDEAHAEESVCIAAKFLNSLTGKCGTDPRNLAAGFNGGPKACAISRDCEGTLSCTGAPMRAWECPWDNKAHTKQNKGYIVTRQYGSYITACVK